MADRLPPAEVTFTRDLYHAGVLALCTAVGRLPDQQSRVLVLGHNPGWEDAVKWLTGHRVSLTTANAVLLSANGSTWTDVLRSGAWTIETVFRPKELF
jgi:phosphohistidine phosphatase SixA